MLSLIKSLKYLERRCQEASRRSLLPYELPAVGTVGRLSQVSGHKLVSVDLVDPPSHSPLAFPSKVLEDAISLERSCTLKKGNQRIRCHEGTTYNSGWESEFDRTNTLKLFFSFFKIQNPFEDHHAFLAVIGFLMGMGTQHFGWHRFIWYLCCLSGFCELSGPISPVAHICSVK